MLQAAQNRVITGRQIQSVHQTLSGQPTQRVADQQREIARSIRLAGISLDDSARRTGEESHGTMAVATAPTVRPELQGHLAAVSGQVFQGAPVAAVAGARNLLTPRARGTGWAVRLKHPARF